MHKVFISLITMISCINITYAVENNKDTGEEEWKKIWEKKKEKYKELSEEKKDEKLKKHDEKKSKFLELWKKNKEKYKSLSEEKKDEKLKKHKDKLSVWENIKSTTEDKNRSDDKEYAKKIIDFLIKNKHDFYQLKIDHLKKLKDLKEKISQEYQSLQLENSKPEQHKIFVEILHQFIKSQKHELNRHKEIVNEYIERDVKFCKQLEGELSSELESKEIQNKLKEHQVETIKELEKRISELEAKQTSKEEKMQSGKDKYINQVIEKIKSKHEWKSKLLDSK